MGSVVKSCTLTPFLNLEVFGSKLEAKVLGREHHEKHNHQHSSLGDLTPAEFAARCLAPLRPSDFVETACAPHDSVTNPFSHSNWPSFWDHSTLTP